MSRRKRQDEKKAPNLVDLGQKIGLTLMSDATNVDVADWLPTGIPQIDRILGGGIPFGRVK